MQTIYFEDGECKFCGRKLKRKKLIFNIGNTEMKIDQELERCTCQSATNYWKLQDEKAERIKKEKEEWMKQDRIRKLYEYSKINPRLKGYMFENFRTEELNRKALVKAKDYADQVLFKKSKSLIITGNVGTGKTHLASSIANYLIKNEVRVIFGTLINLLGEVKDTYKNDAKTESNIIERYSKVPLLIIDDLGKEKPSEWTLEKLFTIINNRYENNLPIVITTNYNRDQLRERLANNQNYIIADSIISRLYQMCSGISLKGSDKRKKLV